MTLREKFEIVFDYYFTETKDEIKQTAIDQLLIKCDEFINEHYLSDKRKIKWITAEEGLQETYNKLYLAWQPGYPLMVADWRTGRGYRDVNTNLSIRPIYVAYIDMPEIKS